MKTAERRGKYQTVIIALKISAGVTSRVMILLHSQTFVADELAPFHFAKIRIPSFIRNYKL